MVICLWDKLSILLLFFFSPVINENKDFCFAEKESANDDPIQPIQEELKNPRRSSRLFMQKELD